MGRRCAAFFGLASLILACPSLAQNHGVDNQGWDQRLYYSSQLYNPANPLEAPSREYSGVPVGPWMVYASVLTGVVWDDNIFQASSSSTSDWGARVRPSLELALNNGIHKTTIYGFVDGRFYGNESDANVVNGSVGVKHAWEVERDFIVRAEFDYSRRTDINNAGTLLTSGGPVTIVSPLDYGIITGSLSGQKSFGPLFVALGGVVAHTNYDDVKDSLGQNFDQDGRDQTVYSISGRLGMWMSPVFYAFVEPAQNWRRFRDSRFDSEGQRVVAGIGSESISLFRGELFAGYQRQSYDDSSFGVVDGGVYGGRVSWHPTRDLMFTLNVDRTISDATQSTPGNLDGSPVEMTSVGLRSDYILTDIWSLSARFGYALIDYEEGGRQDDRWTAGATINYFIWRNLAATFEWEYVNLVSNVAGNSFDRNIFTLGATYKY